MNETEKIKNIDLFCKSLKNFEKEVVLNLNNLDEVSKAYFAGQCAIILRDKEITLKHFYAYIFFIVLTTHSKSTIAYLKLLKEKDKNFEKNFQNVKEIFENAKKLKIKKYNTYFEVSGEGTKDIKNILREQFSGVENENIWKLKKDNKTLLSKILNMKYSKSLKLSTFSEKSFVLTGDKDDLDCFGDVLKEDFHARLHKNKSGESEFLIPITEDIAKLEKFLEVELSDKKVSDKKNSLILETYSDKSVVLRGDKDEVLSFKKVLMDDFGAKYNPNLQGGPGWIISIKKDIDKLQKLLNVKLIHKKSEESVTIDEKPTEVKTKPKKETEEVKKKPKKKESDSEEVKNKKVFDKKHQKKESDLTSPLYYFYTSLYKENNESNIAIRWLTTNGIFEGKERQSLEKKYEQLV